jgi:hypothetical protein
VPLADTSVVSRAVQDPPSGFSRLSALPLAAAATQIPPFANIASRNLGPVPLERNRYAAGCSRRHFREGPSNSIRMKQIRPESRESTREIRVVPAL